MKSTEKVLAALEFVQDAEDDDLAEAIPIKGAPVGLVRGALMLVADQMPRDAAELDAFLTQVGDFCHNLRSDDEPAAVS